jgi:serine/threonine protein kinase
MTDLSSLPITPGALVAGKYRTERLLGQGGMGAVVLARDETTGQPLAIKFLLPSLRDEGHFVGRFRREAQATARLSSEHVPRVLDVGSTAEGAPFIVMEYCEGRDLRVLVKEDGPLPEHEAAAYIGQACVALAEAHALGIVHRDLKPSNLLLSRSADGKPLVKVLDFGVAKVRPTAEDEGNHITATGTILGSRLFMAPEQMRRPRDVDARADIWALGVCLYYLVTGHTPFEATSTEEVILAVVMHPPKPLRDHAPRVSAAFEAVVLRCLEKSPRERFESVTELVRALAPLTRSPTATPSAPRPSAPKPSPAPALDDGATEASLSAAPTRVMDARLRTAIVEANARRSPPRSRRGRRSSVPLVAGASLALGVLVGLGALALWKSSSASPADAASPPETRAAVATSAPAAPQGTEHEVAGASSAPLPAAPSAVSDAAATPTRPPSAAPSPRGTAASTSAKPAPPAATAPSLDSPW